MVGTRQATGHHGEPGETYESLRPYLFSVAYRMTGAASDAEDLVQDAWMRYLDAGSPAVASLKAYLTTIVSRLTLDYLKSARVTRETYVGTWLPEPVPTHQLLPDLGDAVEQREAVSIAFLALIDRLTPDQRVVFVLRSGFDLPFADIGDHLGRSSAACRQLYQRAERVLTNAPDRPNALPSTEVQRDVAEAFLSAMQAGNLAVVKGLLTEEAIWMGDGGPNQHAVRRPVRGGDKVARGLVGLRDKFLDLRVMITIEDINGSPAVIERLEGVIIRVTGFTYEGNRISRIHTMLNPDKLRYLRTGDGSDANH